MCGISGFYSSDSIYSLDDLKLMTDSLKHRGPDASGYYYNQNIGLGHRRLSIIDLSTNANQPMESANGRYIIAYNGEVYNYREIASELKQKFNINLKTSSDTEVILEAYSHYGPQAIEKLNGMFAIAIYDKEKHELFICRDRIGIKPLYYFWDGNTFVFASELKSIIQLKNIPLDVNENAIYYFLQLGFIPAPLSIYKSIKKLESATWIRVSNKKIETKKYWDLKSLISEKTITKEKEAIVKLSDLIMSSVQYQIKSDVPFGVFLSGGIDSSLVTANAVNLSGVKVNTFSIGFEENKFNESAYAKAVANHLNTNHHEFIVSYKDAINLIDNIIESHDEPFADSSSIPTMLVSKLAKQHVTVTLSGEGGDELFLGYGTYQWAKRLSNPIVGLLKNQIKYILENTSKKYNRHANYFTYPKNLKYSHILSQEQNYFSINDFNKLLSHKFNSNIANTNRTLFTNYGIEVEHLNRNLNAMEKQALFDLHFYLQDDLLTKVDRASMQYSLETRVPYLDHRIIEFAINLSPNLKYKDGVTKYILKEILYQYIPKKIFDRPKQGFAIPMEKWLKNELKYLIEENLSKAIIEKYNYVTYEHVQTLIRDFFNDKGYLYNRIWLLIILHKWLIKNKP